MGPDELNFHHLRYFWAVAREGNLTRAARGLHVSQSALSAQIRQLEARLRAPLFRREGRRLVLTEAGQLALGYAEDIFASGAELLATLRDGRGATQALGVGAVATLSRNFQESFVKPLLGRAGVRLRLRSGSFDELLARLAGHELDVVLSNRPAPREAGAAWRSRRLARQPVSVVGHRRPRRRFRFPRDLAGTPLIVPGPDSALRGELEALCVRSGVRVDVLAEVDDMASMRLLARDSGALAVLPSVVVRDELRAGLLHECCVVPDLLETFYAITVERRFPHPLVAALLRRDEAELLAMGAAEEAPAPKRPRRR